MAVCLRNIAWQYTLCGRRRESYTSLVTTDPSFEDEPPIDDQEEVERFQFSASKTQTQRIDQFLAHRVSYLSRAAVQRLIDDGLVKVNGKPTKASYKLKEGDAVEMLAPPEPVN